MPQWEGGGWVGFTCLSNISVLYNQTSYLYKVTTLKKGSHSLGKRMFKKHLSTDVDSSTGAKKLLRIFFIPPRRHLWRRHQRGFYTKKKGLLSNKKKNTPLPPPPTPTKNFPSHHFPHHWLYRGKFPTMPCQKNFKSKFQNISWKILKT